MDQSFVQHSRRSFRAEISDAQHYWIVQKWRYRKKILSHEQDMFCLLAVKSLNLKPPEPVQLRLSYFMWHANTFTNEDMQFWSFTQFNTIFVLFLTLVIPSEVPRDTFSRVSSPSAYYICELWIENINILSFMRTLTVKDC